MIPIWAMMLAKAAWKAAQEQAAKDRAAQAVQAAKEQAAQLRIERAKPCCASCTTEVARGVLFCHSCGSSEITTRGVVLDRQAEEKRLADEQAAKKQAAEQARLARERAAEQDRLARERREKERRAAARQRCREVLAWRYCEPCHTAFEPSHKFCTGCGGTTAEFPRSFAFEHASGDFPDLIKSQADFDAFA